MTRGARRAILAAALGCSLVPGGRALVEAQAGADWRQFQGSPAHLGNAGGVGVEPPLEVVWSFDDPLGEAGLSSPVVAGDTVVAVGATRVYGLDLATGAPRFGLLREEGPLASPAIALVQGSTVLLFTEGETEDESELVAVDLETQDRLFEVELQDVSRGGVAVHDDRAFLGDRSGRLYAVDLSSGEVDWTYESGDRIDSTPAVSDGRAFFVASDVRSGEVVLVAVNTETGRAEWEFGTVPGSVSASVPTVDGDLVFVGFSDRVARAIDASSGQERWASRTREPFSPLTSGAITEGDVLLSDATAGLYRLDGETGERLWDFQFDSAVLRSAPVAGSDVAFLGLDDGRIAAVDLSSGTMVWEGGTGDGALGPIALLDDTLLVKKGGRRGGVVLFRHDPDGRLVRVASPTDLELSRALLNFVLAFAAVFGALLVLFRFIVRESPSSPAPSQGEASIGSREDGPG